MGILFAIFTALLLGTANVLLKKSFKDFAPSISFFILSIFAVLLWVPVGLLLRVEFNTWLFGTFVGFMSAILGQAIYIYVLEKGELSITTTILSSFSIYTILFSVLFIQERLTPAMIVFVVLTIVGTIIVTLPEKLNNQEVKKTSFILWAVFAAACIGASDTLTKHYITSASVGSFLFYVSFSQLIVSFLYLKWEKQPLNQLTEIVTKFRRYRYALLGSLFIAVATMFLFLSFNFTLASIASPIAASSPIVTIVLALIFLKEKISSKNWIGLTLVMISIIGIGFVS